MKKKRLNEWELFKISTIQLSFFFLQEYRTTFCKILECKNKYDLEYGVDLQFAK